MNRPRRTFVVTPSPIMNILGRPPKLSVAVAMAVTAALAACATTAPNNAALDDAQYSFARAAGNPEVARAAPVELQQAQDALQHANTLHTSGGDAAAVSHYAYLARQHVAIAEQASAIAQAQRAVADASSQRDQILIASRTRDAAMERNAAEQARQQADAERARAQAAQRAAAEATVAAQTSQDRASSAQARARSLEEQLADLQARQTDHGMVLTLGDVLFDTASATLTRDAMRPLDQLADYLKAHPERRVTIEGYTDSQGSETMNLALSEQRATAVLDALRDRGVPVDRLVARGMGESQPVASNATAAGRQRNRRVEIVLTGEA